MKNIVDRIVEQARIRYILFNGRSSSKTFVEFPTETECNEKYKIKTRR